MKLLLLSLSLILVGLTGCDGRGKILYLQPATAIKPPWSVASVVIPIEGREDVVAIVTKVASELLLDSDPKMQNRWWVSVDERNKFLLSVRKEDGGYWAVSLIDWPTTRRSQQSLKAEEMIRSALKEPSQNL
jgi:hypothetical protein